MSTVASGVEEGGSSSRVESFSLLSAGASALLPAAAAVVYGFAALHPERVSEQLGLALAAYFLSQLPLTLVSAAFSAAMYIDGPAVRRVLIYLAVVGVAVGLGWAAMKSAASVFAPAVGSAVATQTFSLLFLGRDAARARRRVSAVAEDSVNLIILACWAIAASLILGVIVSKYAAGTLASLGIELRLSDVAWVVAAYFVLRGVSAGYVHTTAFARSGKGLFDRPWINWLVRNLGRSGRRQGSD
jgi:hypothetical protein